MKLMKPSWIHHDGHPIFSIDIHPDDTRFATGGQGDDNTGRVVIWNLKAVIDDSKDGSLPKLLCQLDHHNACVNSVRWSNSGKYLASGGDDKVVIVWKLISKYSGHSQLKANRGFEINNLEIWKTDCCLRGHDGDVLDLAWSPDDSYLASCSIDNSVRVWNVNNFPQLVTTLDGHTSMVKGVIWDPIGKYIASQSVDKTLRIWRTADWSTEQVIKDPFIDCGGTTHVLRIGWSPDGTYLVSAHAINYGFPTAQIIERDGWKIDKDFVGHTKAVVCVRFSNHIHEQNSVRHCCVALGSRDRSVSIWSTALRRPVVVIKDAFSHSVMDLTWSHCGKLMLGCSSDGSVMALQFTYEEIGRPVSQEDKEAFYQKQYGTTTLSKNHLTIVPNMEVYLARKIKLEESQSSKQEIIPLIKREIDESKSNSLSPKRPAVEINKGPTAQIETRTLDGKRRITPKFLPLPTEESVVPTTSRDDSTVFTSSSDGVPGKKDENLRETMVSSIDEVAFNDKKVVCTLNNGTEQSNGSRNGHKQDSPVKVTAMEVDLVPVVNGVGSSQSESEKNCASSNGNEPGTGEGAKTNVMETSSLSKGVNGNTAVAGSDSEVEMGNSSKVSGAAEAPTPVTIAAPPVQEDASKKDVNMIQVKRKRPLEDIVPSSVPSGKKKFNPQTLRTFPPKKAEEVLPESAATPTAPRLNLNQKSSCSAKLRLPPLKIETSSVLQVQVKPDASYSIEVTNNVKGTDGVSHRVKCQHLPSSMQGLEWTICTDAPICAMTGDMHRIVASCEDATVHVLDLKGRYAMSPFVLSGYPSKMMQNGAFLLIVTVKANAHIWNIHNKSVVLKSESLLPILNQPGSCEPDKSVDIVNMYINVGVPVIFLSNGKSFVFNKEMCTWTLLSDTRGLVSAPIMPDAGDLLTTLQQIKMNGRKRKPEAVILSHIKLQLIRATEMKRANSIQQWLLVLAKTLASHGLEKELHILCEDLLGPTHSSAKAGVTWMPKLADCVDKRGMLRNILNNLLDDLRWQDFFCEFDDLLKEVGSTTTTS